jgi:hypothetical protein
MSRHQLAYSITSSARRRIEVGSVMPSALDAVDFQTAGTVAQI